MVLNYEDSSVMLIYIYGVSLHEGTSTRTALLQPLIENVSEGCLGSRINRCLWLYPLK